MAGGGMPNKQGGKPRKTNKKVAKKAAKRPARKATKKKATCKKSTTKRTSSKNARELPKHGAWKENFLKALEMSLGHVGGACKAVGIARSTAYDERKRDKAFAIAWDEMVSYGLDEIEMNSRICAARGTVEPVFHEGSECGEKLRQYPVLQMFHLRNGRPEQYNKRIGYGHGTVLTADDANSARAKAALLVDTVQAMIGTVSLWDSEAEETDDAEG